MTRIESDLYIFLCSCFTALQLVLKGKSTLQVCLTTLPVSEVERPETELSPLAPTPNTLNSLKEMITV